MQPESQLKWLFLDLNSYFASVEQQERPELRGRPIAVVPMETDSTCAIAASREARAYGVKTGTMIFEAKRLCPRLICVPARHRIYVDYHHRVIDEVIRHVPIDRIWSIDELASRLPPRLRNREDAIAAAQRLKQGMRKNIGACITCSIGIAPNSFLAKIATDLQKPDGLVILEPGALPGPLLDLKLKDIPGINVSMERRLIQAGITSVEQLWTVPPKHARQIWGSVAGERFYYNLHGYDIPVLESDNTSSVGHSRVLDPALRHPAAARLIARRLAIKAAARLRRKENYATSFYMSVRTTDKQRWDSEIRMEPSQDNFSFLEALDSLWALMLAELRPQAIKKVSLTLTRLRQNHEMTNDLFTTSSPAIQKTLRRREDLSRVMDIINDRYGAETLRLGAAPCSNAGSFGTKIAFSRIPDRAEFHE